MIQGCQFLITDSFHGVCFAIIFKKSFIALCNKNRGAARFESILKLLGLEDRLINSLDDYHDIKEIDWDNVYKVLNELKIKSSNVLQSMVDKSSEHKNLSDYDFYMPLISSLEYKLETQLNQRQRNKSILQKVFSIKNCNEHKVITILGFKISFKRRLCK